MPTLSKLPRELIDRIFHYSPSVSTANATLAFGFEPRKTDELHGALWRAIFKSDQWLNKITEIGANPVLIGANLENFCFPGKPREPKSVYIVLHSDDRYDEVRYHRELFFQCLWEQHQFNEKRREIRFPWGITLNVSEPLYYQESEFLKLKKRNLRQLFSYKDKQLRSQYSFFRDKEIKILQPPHIIGLGGPVFTLKALTPGYALNLFQFGEKIQFCFKRAGVRQIRATAWEDPRSSLVTVFKYRQR